MESFKSSAQWRVRTACLRSLRPGRRAFALILVAAAFLLGSPSARAQNTGSIFGTVQDTTGAVIPGAAITATDNQHGIARTVQSNGSGEFLISALPVGTYSLTSTLTGFQTFVVTGIKVDAESNIKEIVKMSIGSAKDTVTVTDETGSALDARSATLGTLIDQKLIEDLPIDGHNVVALSALLPGVVDVNAPTTFTGDTGGPTYAASGSRNTQNLFLFDGLMWNNLFYNTGVNFPPPNALQEVSVLLNNYKAEYGRNAGSIFNVITKKGTNQIHGAVWDYIQNQYFNAADYITQVNPKDNVNQFGFTFGAPILKDKLFLFTAFQDLIGHLETTGAIPPLGFAERGLNPDGSARPCSNNGPFPGMSCASYANDVPPVAGVLGKFINPLEVAGTSGAQAEPTDAISMINAAYQQAGGVGDSPCLALLNQAATYAGTHPYGGGTKLQPTYMPNAEVPTVCLNPVITKLLNTFVPTSVAGLQTVTNTPAPTGDQNLLIRTDYVPSGRHSFDIRYNFINSTAKVSQGVDSSSAGIAGYAGTDQKALSNFGNVGWTWVMTPNLLNQLRFGYKRFEATQFPLDHRTLNSFGGNFVETGIPTLPALSFSNQFKLGSTSQGFQDHINENVELNEQLSWTKGNHSFMAGFQFLRLQYLNRSDYPGQLSFSTTFTGSSIGDGLLGLASSTQAENRLIQGGIQHSVFSYLQDDWRATSKLTLNLGVRYELPFQWFEPHGQAATFIPGIQSTTFPNAIGGLGFPGDKGVLPSLVPTDYNGIAPRVGFAYDVTGRGNLLVRGGYGIFFDAVNANVVGVGEPFHYNFFTTLPAGGASQPLLTLTPDPHTVVIPDHYDKKNPQFIAPFSIFFPDHNFRTPYVEAVNFGFEYHIPHGGVLDTNYVGKFARKLTIPLDLNPAIYDCTGGYSQADHARYCSGANSTQASTRARVRYAPFNYGGQGIVDILTVGTSSYNALQMQYQQRGGKYLTILSSYTFSKSIDLQTNGQTTSNTAPDVFNIKSERGPSDNNAKHNFTLGWVARFPKVTQAPTFVRAAVNNWVYSGKFLAHTGRPFSVTINNDTALDGEPGQRAALLPGVNPLLPSNRHRADKVNEYFNRDAFTYPVVGTFSSVGRNAFTGPGYLLTDMTLGRDFPMARLREGMRLNVRAEAFNVFNTPNLANPYSNFSCSTTTTYTGVQGPNQVSESCPAAGGNYPVNSLTQKANFGNIRSTFGNNANTSTNGRKMQFAITLFY